MKRIMMTMLAVAVLFGLVLGGFCEGEAKQKPIELSWVSFHPANFHGTKILQKMFVDRINEAAKGELIIKHRGGPETIHAMELGNATKKGVVDIGNLPVGYYEPVAPGIGALMLSQLTVLEERKGGAYEYLDELHKKGGLKYLGRGNATLDPFFYTHIRGKRVETQEDFKKLKLGGVTAGRSAVMGWGSSFFMTVVPEWYPALERKVVDGIAGSPLTTAHESGFYELVDYVIDHPWYANTVAVIMNLDKWNKLPEHLQKLITDFMIEYENETVVMNTKAEQDAKQKIAASGVEFVTLSPDVAKWYLESAYKAGWDYQQKKFPEPTPRLKELLSK